MSDHMKHSGGIKNPPKAERPKIDLPPPSMPKIKHRPDGMIPPKPKKDESVVR